MNIQILTFILFVVLGVLSITSLFVGYEMFVDKTGIEESYFDRYLRKIIGIFCMLNFPFLGLIMWYILNITSWFTVFPM